MKKLFLIVAIIFTISTSALAQKLTEPKLLGTWIAGEDPSEFLLHSVMEYSQSLLEENSEGKLIVRICSLDGFSAAFIKAPLNPLAANRYNQYRLLVPYEKIFIANSSKCMKGTKFIVNQYWFVPDGNTLEYDEIYSVNNISYKNFYVSDYDFSNNKEKSLTEQNKEFAENVEEFTSQLKNNPKAEGFIVHCSKNRKMKRNIENVLVIAKKEDINVERIKTIIRPKLDVNEKGKLFSIKDEGNSFPLLGVIEVKK